jgi:nitroreductase
MDVFEAIERRGSVKAFESRAVPRAQIERLLEAAIRAPNHRLTEPWGFHVVRGESKRRLAELRRELRARKFEDPDAPEVRKSLEKAYRDAAEVPAIIVVTTAVAEDPVQREEDYAATWCAIENLLLSATALGLGTYVRTGALIGDGRLREILDLHDDRRPVAAVYLGYPAEPPKLKPRTPAAQKTRWLD